MRDIIISGQHFPILSIKEINFKCNKGYRLKNIICISLQSFCLKLESVAFSKCSKQSMTPKSFRTADLEKQLH